MKRTFLIILLILIIQNNCEFTTYDGSKLVSLSYSPNYDYDATERVCIENFSQEMISYYSWFASYGYCDDVNIPLFCCKNYLDFFTEKWQIVSESSIDEYFDFNFVLWRNDEYKKFVLAFPGTRHDIIELLGEAVNSKLVEYDDKGVKVVNYFYKVMLKMKEIIFTPEVLSDIDSHPGYQVIVTGHSLGGAVASLIIYEAVNRNYISPEYNEPVLITLGQPRTGNEQFVIDFNSKIKNYFRVVRDGDIVASIPYLLINNPYKHLGGLILVNKEMTSMNYCPLDIGEDYPDKECVRTKSVDIRYHIHYFNPDTHFSDRCR
jgi:hypothetical protein